MDHFVWILLFFLNVNHSNKGHCARKEDNMVWVLCKSNKIMNFDTPLKTEGDHCGGDGAILELFLYF